jgi:proteasome lid subunit RPN8/RPN11
MTLALSEPLAVRIREHGERGYPEEVCGLLLGRERGDGAREVVELFPLENERADSRVNRYSVSALSMLRAERRAREAGLDVVGYYHSHPNAPARPSGYDLDHATWPNISYPIVAVHDGRAVDLRSWVLAEDRSEFAAEDIVPEITPRVAGT